MRSALFLHDDESLINRIKITVHDDNAQYFYAQSIDDLISILDSNEIAVVFMPYNFDVLSGNEMIEIVLDHNPKAQIISLFKDEELIDVVRSHNVYHLCQIICEDFFKIEDLQSLLETAFDIYNRDDKLKSFERTYREKEDKYKRTILSMSSLLNDRSESYKLICGFFRDTVEFINDNTIINSYFDNLLKEYIDFALIFNDKHDDYLNKINEICNDSTRNHYLKVETNNLKLDNESNILFIIYILTRYFIDFDYQYKGKIEINEQDMYYSINMIFEVYPNMAVDLPRNEMLILIEHIFKNISEKVLFAVKDKIIQYRIICKKSSYEA